MLKSLGSAICHWYFREGKNYKVHFGPMRGCKIAFFKSAMSYREVLGFWEYKTLRIIKRLAKADKHLNGKLCIADIGANIGYYTLFFSKIFPSASVYAFEPLPEAVNHLKRNLRINYLDGVSVIEAAVADTSGEIEFYFSPDQHLSSIVGERAGRSSVKSKVKAVTLDDYFEQKGFFPDLIKMDIEGGAVYALKGCHKCFTMKRPILFIESHAEPEDLAIGEHMVQYNYKAFRINTGKWVVNRKASYKDPDGVWGTMVLIPEELNLDDVLI